MSFQWVERFESQLQTIGYKQAHIVLLLRYAKMLFEQILAIVIKDMDSVSLAKKCLTQCAVFLIKAQEHLKN